MLILCGLLAMQISEHGWTVPFFKSGISLV
jgi:hypothetical protein